MNIIPITILALTLWFGLLIILAAFEVTRRQK
jgi:hypothetical protein